MGWRFTLKNIKSQLPMLETGGIVDTINIFANIPYLFNMYSNMRHWQLYG